MHQLVSRSNPCLQSVTRKRYSELCASMTLTQQASCLVVSPLMWKFMAQLPVVVIQ